MSEDFIELFNIFDDLYNKGYRFINSVEEQVMVETPFDRGVYVSSVVDRRIKIDGELVSYDEIEKGINFIMFRKAVKLKDGRPLIFR